MGFSIEAEMQIKASSVFLFYFTFLSSGSSYHVWLGG